MSNADAASSSGASGTERLIGKFWHHFGFRGSGRKNSVAKDRQPAESRGATEDGSVVIPESGWQRIKKVYTDGDVHAETHVTVRMTRLAFVAGMFVGGFFRHQDKIDRYELHSQGKIFLSRGDILRRKWDYGIIMFARNGFKAGMRSAVLVGSIIFLTGHISAWRDRFSAWYFPAISAPICTILALPYGGAAALGALGLGTSTGLALTAVSYAIAYELGKTVDDAYKDAKKNYEDDVKRRKEAEKKLLDFMKENNIKWRGEAHKLMKKKKEMKSFAAELEGKSESRSQDEVKSSLSSNKIESNRVD